MNNTNSRSSLVRRRHSESQVTEAYAALHALLLTAFSTRAAATRQVIQHLLQTSQHLPYKTVVSSATTAAVDGSNSSIGQVGGGDAGEDSGNGDISGGASNAADELHDQLADISSGVAALDQAVAAHQDGDVCREIWKQLLHLAAPAGQYNVMLFCISATHVIISSETVPFPATFTLY